jgi:hypothetical protein
MKIMKNESPAELALDKIDKIPEIQLKIFN